MKRKDKDKLYEFIKLCSALTKQGFDFTRDKNVAFGLCFKHNSEKRLSNPYIKLPFVKSIIYSQNNNCIQFEQWSGK